MKLKEKHAEDATIEYWNGVSDLTSRSENGYYDGFLAGFEKVREMADQIEWNAQLLGGVSIFVNIPGEEEV